MNWKCRLLMMLAISANCAATNSDASRQHIREKKHVSDGDQVHVLPVDDVRPKRSGNNGDGEGVGKDSQTALTEGKGEAAQSGGEGEAAAAGEGPTAPSGEGPAAVGDGEKPAQPAAGGDGGGPANSGDGNEPQARQIPVAPLQSHGYVDFDGKKCRFGKDKESAKASSPINGKVIVNQHPGRAAFPKCMADFDKIAEKKMCGTDYYELFAYCLKANFFGQQGVEHVRGSKFMERPQKPPTSIKDHQANYMQDMALVIIEGCLQCMGGNNDAKQKAKIQLVQHHPVGPIRQVCGLEDETASGEIEVSLSDSSFIISAILLERFCPSRPNANDSNIMLAPLRYAHNISISVTHTCDDSKKETVEIFRLSKLIELAKLQDHVFELREVSIKLNDKGPIREPSNGESPSQNQSLPSVPVGGGVIDWDWERKEMGMGYEYYVGAQTESSAQNTNRVQMADEKLDQMKLDREARRDEYTALVGDMIGAGDDDM